MYSLIFSPVKSVPTSVLLVVAPGAPDAPDASASSLSSFSFYVASNSFSSSCLRCAAASSVRVRSASFSERKGRNVVNIIRSQTVTKYTPK